MNWTIWEFSDENGNGVVEAWLREKRIQKKARITLNAKIELLQRLGPRVPPGLLAGPIDKHIYKLRVNAQGVQLRPMLCKGPIAMQAEFTLLLGAIERGSKLQPKDALKRAAKNRKQILSEPLRRRPHERFPEQD